MRSLAVVAVSLFCVLAQTIAGAGTTKQFVIAKDSQAIIIVQTAIAAMGGASADMAYQDSQASGTLTVHATNPPTTFPITLKCKGTQETRAELEKPDGTNVRIVNQGKGTIQRANGKVIQLSMKNTIAERVSYIPLLSILGEYLNANVSAQYQGIAWVSGHNTSVVAVSYVPTTNVADGPRLQSITRTLFYIDQVTSLVDKIQYSSWDEDNHGNEKVEVYLTDYQTVNGISLPFHQTTYTDGTLESDLVLTGVSFNVGLSDSEFTLPQ
jgi:hypothetical protein